MKWCGRCRVVTSLTVLWGLVLESRSWNSDEVECSFFEAFLAHQVVDLTACKIIDETWAHEDELARFVAD